MLLGTWAQHACMAVCAAHLMLVRLLIAPTPPLCLPSLLLITRADAADHDADFDGVVDSKDLDDDGVWCGVVWGPPVLGKLGSMLGCMQTTACCCHCAGCSGTRSAPAVAALLLLLLMVLLLLWLCCCVPSCSTPLPPNTLQTTR